MNSDSFEVLYDRVAPALYSWARLKVGSKIQANIDPQDLVQEASARAFEQFDKFDPARGSFRAWLFCIAKNCRNEVLRSSLRSGGTRSGVLRVSQCPDSVTSTSKRLARDDALQELIERISDLDEVDRELFIRCGLEGETTSVAATRMQLSSAGAQKRWVRLREKLRDRAWIRELLATDS